MVSTNQSDSLVANLDMLTVTRKLYRRLKIPRANDLAIVTLAIVQVNSEETSLALVKGFLACDCLLDCIDEVLHGVSLFSD